MPPGNRNAKSQLRDRVPVNSKRWNRLRKRCKMAARDAVPAGSPARRLPLTAARLKQGRFAMTEYKLISADSHVSEPPDLWTSRVDQRYRDRAPRLVTDLPGKEGAYFLYEGHAPHPIGIGLGAGKSPKELKEFLTKATYADARPGGWNPAARVKDNEIDGVEADVLYTTLGFPIFWVKET